MEPLNQSASVHGPPSSHPGLSWALNGPGHAVYFYEDEEYLRSVVVNFLAAGLNMRQPVVSIATPAHTDLFAAGLKQRGFDVAALHASGDLNLTDAGALLDEITIDQTIDPERFRMVLGGILERAGGRRRVVRAYGEMVDVLWKAGNPSGAIQLEKAWNALSAPFHFALLCGYSVGNFMSGQHIAAFEDVCGEHHHVIPTDRRVTVPGAPR